MPLKMTNEVSIMDVVAIGGLLLGGAGIFFGYGANIQENTTEINHLQSDVSRIERSAEKSEQKILTQLGEIKQDAAKDRQDIKTKLDRLIERQIPRPVVE